MPGRDGLLACPRGGSAPRREGIIPAAARVSSGIVCLVPPQAAVPGPSPPLAWQHVNVLSGTP